jgi:hypothetical protein
MDEPAKAAPLCQIFLPPGHDGIEPEFVISPGGFEKNFLAGKLAGKISEGR